MTTAAKNGQSTAVATVDPNDEIQALLATPSAEEAARELEKLRAAGMALVEKKRALALLKSMVEGTEWGSVKGASMSPATQYAIAEICYITGANPHMHLDILGGKPYHNAKYFKDLVSQHSHYKAHRQRNLLKSFGEMLARQAADLRAEVEELVADAEKLGMPELKDKARELRLEMVRLRSEAREHEQLRLHYRIPDSAVAAYETQIDRYRPGAPIDAINSGSVAGEPFLETIAEANWVGPDKSNDPVGKAHPDLTCRTRSFRRAAEVGFSTWMEPKFAEIQRVERQIEADYRIIRDDDAQAQASLPKPNGAQAVQSGAGEPKARAPEGAKQLPTEEAGQDVSPPPFDASDARKAYFATLREAGIEKDAERKKWQVEQGLGESTKDWGAEEYSKAMDALLEPARQQVLEGAAVLGEDAQAMAEQMFGGALRELTLKQLKELGTAISARVDGAEAEANGQRRLV